MDNSSKIQDTKRLFIGIPVPPEISSRIMMLKTLVPAVEEDIRWVFGRNLHLTLSFLGQISSNAIEKVDTVLAESINQSRFNLSIEKSGVFPNTEKPRIFWMDIIEGRDPLIALQTVIDNSVNNLKENPDNKPYVPHVTIGRSNKNSRLWKIDLAHFLNAEYDPIKFEINKVFLYQSELLPHGAKYTVLKEYPLI